MATKPSDLSRDTSSDIYTLRTYLIYEVCIQVKLVVSELVVTFGAYRKPKRPKTKQILQLTGTKIGYNVPYPVSGSAEIVWHARQNHRPSVVTSPDRLSQDIL